MISDELLQEDLVTKLKTISSVTSLLPDGLLGIRELQWKGSTFGYPNVRIDLEDNKYVWDEQKRCTLQQLDFSLYIFSQERSSKECSTIKGLLENYLTGIGFTGANARFIELRLSENVPAVSEDVRTWRSQLRYQVRIQNP